MLLEANHGRALHSAWLRRATIQQMWQNQLPRLFTRAKLEAAPEVTEELSNADLLVDNWQLLIFLIRIMLISLFLNTHSSSPMHLGTPLRLLQYHNTSHLDI